MVRCNGQNTSGCIASVIIRSNIPNGREEVYCVIVIVIFHLREILGSSEKHQR